MEKTGKNRTNVKHPKLVKRSTQSAADSFSSLQAIEQSRSTDSPVAHECRIQVLGEFSITVSGQRFCENFSKRRLARRVVQALASNPDLSDTRTKITEALWPSQSSDAVSNRLHQTIHWIRGEFKSLPFEVRPVIEVTGDRLTLSLQPGTIVDVQQVWRLHDGQEVGLERLAALQDIIELTDAELCSDWMGDALIESRRRSLEVLRRESLEEAAQIAHEHADAELALRFLEDLCKEPDATISNQTELAYRLADTGRTDRAIAHCLALRKRLKQEAPDQIGEVNTLLTHLQQSANQGQKPVATIGQPTSTSQTRYNKVHLVATSSPALGIEELVTELSHLVGSNQGYVTSISGPFGSGKTTVAKAVASKIQSRFRNGALLVNCSDIQTADDLEKRLAAELTNTETAGKVANGPALARLISEIEILVLLDDLRLSKSVYAALGQLVDANSENRWIVTTNEIALSVIGRNYVLNPVHGLLGGDNESSGALNILRWYAQANSPQSTIDRVEIHRLARLVDGLPISLKLIAHLLRLRSPDELVHQLTTRADTLLDHPAPQYEELRSAVERTRSVLKKSGPDAMRLLAKLRYFGSWLTLPEILSLESGATELAGSVESACYTLDKLVYENLLVRRTETIGATERSVYRLSFVTRLAISRSDPGEGLLQNGTDAVECWARHLPSHFHGEEVSALSRVVDARVEDYSRAVRSWSATKQAHLLVDAWQQLKHAWINSAHIETIIEWFVLAESGCSHDSTTWAQLLLCRSELRMAIDDPALAAEDASRALEIASSRNDQNLAALATRQLLKNSGGAGNSSYRPSDAFVRRGFGAGFKLMRVAHLAIRHTDFDRAAAILRDANRVFESFGLHHCALTAQKTRARVAIISGRLTDLKTCASELTSLAAKSGDSIPSTWADLMHVELMLSQAEFDKALVHGTTLISRADVSGQTEIAYRALRAVAWSQYCLGAYKLVESSAHQLLERNLHLEVAMEPLEGHLLLALNASRQHQAEQLLNHIQLAAQATNPDRKQTFSVRILITVIELCIATGVTDLATLAITELKSCSVEGKWAEERVNSIRNSVLALTPSPGEAAVRTMDSHSTDIAGKLIQRLARTLEASQSGLVAAA